MIRAGLLCVGAQAGPQDPGFWVSLAARQLQGEKKAPLSWRDLINSTPDSSHGVKCPELSRKASGVPQLQLGLDAFLKKCGFVTEEVSPPVASPRRAAVVCA